MINSPRFWRSRPSAFLGVILLVIGVTSFSLLRLSAAAAHEHPHADDAQKQEEHLAIFDLVPDASATHISVTSGNWGDPATWSNGAVPWNGARVIVATGHTVTLERVFDEKIKTIRVDGTLRVDPKRDTGLQSVGTIVVNLAGRFEMGTPEARIAADKTARIVFAPYTPEPKDWMRIGGGFVSHSQAPQAVRIFGAPYDGKAFPATQPRKLGNSVTVREPPTGWKPGDELVFASTAFNDFEQVEKRRIVAVSADRKTFALDAPLAYDHDAEFPVVNTTRNAIFQSSSANFSERGHIMFMHTQSVHADGVGVYVMGRTDARRPMTEPKRDPAGHVVPASQDNPAGRYGWHIHMRTGSKLTDEPAVTENCVVVDSPKLGYNNHGGYVHFRGSIAVDCVGSGFFTENGTEIGSFDGNVAIRMRGSGGNADQRSQPDHTQFRPADLGHEGVGLWVQGGGVEVKNNYVANAAREGLAIWRKGEEENGKQVEFLAENLKDPSIAGGKPTISVGHVPSHWFNNYGMANEAGLFTYSPDAATFAGLEGDSNAVDLRFQSTVNGGKFWGNLVGYRMPYTTNTKIVDTQFIGAPEPPTSYTQVFSSQGIVGNAVTRNVVLDNVTVKNYHMGVWLINHSNMLIQGGTFRNTHNFVVQSAALDRLNRAHRRSVTIDLTGMSLSNFPLKLVGNRASYEAQSDFEMHSLIPLHRDRDLSQVFARDEIVFAGSNPSLSHYEGKQLYFNEQAAGFVPVPADAPETFGVLRGSTNQQLWDAFKLAVAGAVLPAGSVDHPRVSGGKLGPRASYLSLIQAYYNLPNGEPVASVSPSFVFEAIYLGLERNFGPNAVRRGWNVLPAKSSKVDTRGQHLLFWGYGEEIVGNYTLTASPASVSAGGSATASWDAPAGHSDSDWIGLYRVGDPDRAYITWFYTGANTTGNRQVILPGYPGEFEFRYFIRNAWTRAATSNSITVAPPEGNFSLIASPTSVAARGTLTIQWLAPAGRPASDWIALFKKGDPNTDYGTWFYTGGTRSGGQQIAAPKESGQYEFRYLLSSGYWSAATSNPLTVK